MAEKDEEPTPADDIVVTKYKMAGDMVNGILKEVIGKCVDGASVLSICSFGDERLLQETGKVFKKDKEMKKGIAFPTCVSVNNCICHFSPLKSDPDVTLKEGDLVKIDLGAHIDGFIAVVAHSLLVGDQKEKVKGRKADVLLAAHNAAEVALRMVKPGTENDTVTEAIQKVAESYKCKPIEGMLSHQLTKHVIDGEKAIIQNPSENQKLFDEEVKARMGVVECAKHDLVQPFSVLHEKNGLPFESELYESEYSVEDEELKSLLSQSASRKAAKKKKKKAGKAVQEQAEAADQEA
ncbi:PA2G4-like protein [Mya arenaria]|uniref:PA2G4-like protein n=1 Tax=Mya arenaria TaxID=6604 RepID=A0ABY7E789_MYAAR|nr:PA2G4-like protein [Mya arenaria]